MCLQVCVHVRIRGRTTMPNEHSRSRQVFFLCVVQVWVVFAFLVLPTLCPTDVFGLPASSSLSLLSLHVQVRLKQCHEGRDESFDTFILDEDKVQIACAVWAPLLSVKRRLASVFSFFLPRSCSLLASLRPCTCIAQAV